MRRVLATFVVLLGAGALVVFGTGATNQSGEHKYWVELDNAFGLIKGGDMKIAGVRAGKVGELKVDRRTNRALVQVIVTKTGFGSLRTDTTCESRPQSLIGEYFLDCQPGTARVELKQGSTIPVSHTSSTVAPDLVNNVLRKPYRERFSIIVNELGAAVAGNGQNLNDAIRRASPGLRETDKVLKILAQQNQVIADLVKNADTVVGDLSDNRKQVARWVVMADRTSRASAQRRTDIAAGFHKFPGFLEQLRPAMHSLAKVTDEQGPALATLSSAAPRLKRFFDLLGPFADASRPAIRSLGKASVTGREAVSAAGSTVAQLNTFAQGTPELAKNLAMILEHLDNRDFAAEADPRSPGGKGYTGLEALLEYVYDQNLSTNIYDSSVHILKVSPFAGDCANYADVKRTKDPAPGSPGPTLLQQCGAALGPNLPGINFADASKPAGAGDARSATALRHRPSDPAASTDAGLAGPVTGAPAGSGTGAAKPAAPTLSDVIPGAPPVTIPSPPKGVTGAATPPGSARTRDDLLRYLLAP